MFKVGKDMYFLPNSFVTNLRQLRLVRKLCEIYADISLFFFVKKVSLDSFMTIFSALLVIGPFNVVLESNALKIVIYLFTEVPIKGCRKLYK